MPSNPFTPLYLLIDEARSDAETAFVHALATDDFDSPQAPIR